MVLVGSVPMLLVLEHQIAMIDQLNQLNLTLPYCNGDPVNIRLPGNPTKQHKNSCNFLLSRGIHTDFMICAKVFPLVVSPPETPTVHRVNSTSA